MEISTVTNTIKTPTFANNSVPVNDPTTGKPNFFASEEVSSDEKLNGFTPAYSKPTRQTFNTLFRVIDKQITWLKETFFPKVKADIETLDSRLGVKTDSASATSDKAHPRIKDLQNRLGQDIDIDTTAFGLANKALGYINSHNHDGGSGTDHAEKVMLTNAAEVQGVLPLANTNYGFARSGTQNIMVTAEGRTVDITSGSCLCYRRNGTASDYPVYRDVAYFVNPNTNPNINTYTIINATNNGFEYEGTGDGIVLAGTAWTTTKWLIIYAVYDSSDDSHKFVAAADWRPIIDTSTTKYIRAISYVGINYSGTPALYSMETNGVRTWFTANTGRLQLFAETPTTAAGVESTYSTGLPTDISNAFYGVAFARVTGFSDPGTSIGTYAIKSGNRISISDIVLALDSSSTVIPIPHMLNNITTSMSNYSGTATYNTTVLLHGFYNPLVDQKIG